MYKMYMYVSDIYFASASKVFQFYFGTVMMVWYFFFISEITKVARFIYPFNDNESLTFYVDVFFPLSLSKLLPDLIVYMSNTAGVNIRRRNCSLFTSIWVPHRFIGGVCATHLFRFFLCCPIVSLRCEFSVVVSVMMFGSSLTKVIRMRARVLLRCLCLFTYSGVQQCCVVFVLFFFVLFTPCCQFFWIVHFWWPFRYSLTFIYSYRDSRFYFHIGIVVWKKRNIIVPTIIYIF